MMDKDQESIATVQMKPEYAASEVYSTASEGPPVSLNWNLLFLSSWWVGLKEFD